MRLSLSVQLAIAVTSFAASIPYADPTIISPSNGSLATQPPLGVPGLKWNDWPIPRFRYQVPRKDLYIRFENYGAVPYWHSSAAHGIYEIENRIRGDTGGQISNKEYHDGPVRIWFMQLDARRPLITRQQAADVLGEIYSFTIAFGPRKVVAFIEVDGEELAFFFLTFAYQRTKLASTT